MRVQVAIIPFDDLHWKGADQSIVHDLTEGEIVGIGYSFMDWDVREGYSTYLFSTYGGFHENADAFNDFQLDPVQWDLFEKTSILSTTWGQIKASLFSLHP